jgi:dienelactone hydrolase
MSAAVCAYHATVADHRALRIHEWLPWTRGTHVTRMHMFRVVWLIGLFPICLSCATLPVEGEFFSARIEAGDPAQTILIIYNHGYSQDRATTFKPGFPPILQRATAQADVMLFSQVRNRASLQRDDHRRYIEAAVDWFHRVHKIPIEQMILAGQSCGGWGALQAAAWTYSQIGGVIAFAPTCHGQLYRQSPWGATEWFQGIGELVRLLNPRTLIFLYEGDAYYRAADWAAFEARLRASPQIQVVTLDQARVLQVCPRCVRDSHGAVFSPGFANEYFDPYVLGIINGVRARINERQGSH